MITFAKTKKLLNKELNSSNAHNFNKNFINERNNLINEEFETNSDELSTDFHSYTEEEYSIPPIDE